MKQESKPSDGGRWKSLEVPIECLLQNYKDGEYTRADTARYVIQTVIEAVLEKLKEKIKPSVLSGLEIVLWDDIRKILGKGEK
jgi:hypothetical protein